MFDAAYGRYGFIVLPGEFFMHVISPVLFMSLLVSFFLPIITNPPSMLFMFTLIAAFLLAVLGLFSFSKFISPTRGIPNPLAVVLAFANSKIFLYSD